MNADITQDALAMKAVEPVRDGMIVGLGTGRAATRGIHALGWKARAESLDIKCVATSQRSATLARELGLPVIEMRDMLRVDYLFDGADEVDPDLRMLKGGGGAMTREKVVASASDHRVYLVQESKLVDHLGDNMRLPVEVLECALGVVTMRFEYLRMDPVLRTTKSTDVNGHMKHELVLTDDGNPIVDCVFGGLSAEEADIALRIMPGVVGHGVFVDQAHSVVVEQDDRSEGDKGVRVLEPSSGM